MKFPFRNSGFAGIALLFILTAPVVMTWTWLRSRKAAIRHEMLCRLEEGVSPDELTLLVFSREEAEKSIHWEHAGEFEFSRQMFDVVKSEEKGDSLYFWCLRDEDETRLNRELALLVNRAFRDDPGKSERQDRLFTFFKSLYCSELSLWNPATPCLEINRPFIPTALFDSLSIPPPKPPPRLS